jgi:hypothetical protein
VGELVKVMRRGVPDQEGFSGCLLSEGVHGLAKRADVGQQSRHLVAVKARQVTAEANCD